MGLVVRCFAHRRTSRQRLRRPAGALALLIARTPHLCCLFAFGIANQTHCTSITGQHGVELEMPVDSDARTQVSNALSVLNLRTEDGTQTHTHTHARAHTHTHARLFHSDPNPPADSPPTTPSAPLPHHRHRSKRAQTLRGRTPRGQVDVGSRAQIGVATGYNKHKRPAATSPFFRWFKTGSVSGIA